MAENSKIEWTDHTFNPWTGCTKVSPGCDHCYAEGWAKRSGHVKWGAGEPRRRTSDANWREPLKWNARAAAEGRRFRVFCSSLADVFDNQVPAEWRADLFRLIDATPHLDWLLLTKRIGNAARMLPSGWLRQPIYGQLPDWPAHVRIGATFVNQEEVNRDMHKLLGLGCPNFASLEPLLGPIRLDSIQREGPDGDWTYEDNALTGFQATKNGGFDGKRLDWVIVGGESGPGARPMHPDWARSLRDQCAAAGVPFLFKQWGEWVPDRQQSLRDALAHRDFTAKTVRFHRFDEATRSTKVGKKAAGRRLDCCEHNGFPAA